MRAAILGVNPILLAVTCATVAGIGWMLFDEWRANRPRPPYLGVDDWNWDDWQDDE